ncbi:hypothetical protein AURDEDRAFT_157159 [Auricularia subglabra TFB-10046 SS5]|nr:hypothetical protein AURDEDRAFT_157159 [Auricularia subglabra TFB-10046 SS5]
MPNVDRYTHPLRTRHRDVKRTSEEYVHLNRVPGDNLRHSGSTENNLVVQLEQHVAETEKKWAWIASSFDDELPASDAHGNTTHLPNLAAQPMLPMPQPLSPFSLSTIPHFTPTKTPDASTAAAGSERDTSAGDLSLYRWLSAQGAQTILPGPAPVFTPPPNKRVSALNHLARPRAPPTPSPEQKKDNAAAVADFADSLPLSPPPSGRLLFSAQFDTPEQPLPLSLAFAGGRKSAPDFLPVSPPATPVIAQFRETKELTALPVHADDSFACATDEDLPSPRSFDLGHALSRNLSLQHASSAALRSYKLVVQEFKLGAFPSRRGGVDYGPVPGLTARDQRALGCSQGGTDGNPVEDSSTQEFAALLTRQAADEELQVERLRALATRLQDIARQRRLLAAKVLPS